MKSLMPVLVGLLFALPGFAALPTEYQSIKAEAEKYYAQDSYAKAHELYQSLNLTNLPPAERRWVRFRLADTQWRSEASTRETDTSKLDEARRELEAFVSGVTREQDRDLVWADAEESLGDFYWMVPRQRNWSKAWGYYQKALDWWAGSSDIATARSRYLRIIWRTAHAPETDYYNYWSSQVPLQFLENALKIARTKNDKAHAHFLIAMALRRQGGPQERLARVPGEFEAALEAGKSSDWYDDALYHYAEFLASYGRPVQDENGHWQFHPDYAKALQLFRRVVTEFEQGQTRYWEPAQQQIKNITEPQVGVSVGNIFLPGSEIQYNLTWRNVRKIDLALYPVDLNRDVNPPAADNQAANWLSSIDLAHLEKIKSWTYKPAEEFRKDYRPGNKQLRLEPKLKPGAYVLEARGGGKSARELILVTDTAVVLKASGKQALVYVCNAIDGSPAARAKVKLWQSWWQDNHWHCRAEEKTANQDGIAVFDLETLDGWNRQMFASAIREDRQAFSQCRSYWGYRRGEPWKIYAFTDRPAYRPNETVHWKFTARRYDGSVYSTPAQAPIEFEITDPRGAKVKSDKVKLNAFGSAWGSLELTGEMPLGEYRVTFWDEGRKHQIGSATLFRLEEYKLPEFKVTVQTPEENGKKKAFRLGEQVQATIQADYYFGGPVADATVEVLVHQRPYWHLWHEPHPYPWLYQDMERFPGYWGGWYGGGQVIKRETLKTDATGKATLTFDTPANSSQDYEYRIEARVTDASRREITGTGTVRVTRQRYYVHLRPGHNLYRPQDRVTVNIKALDANDQPVQTEGKVKVTRDYWFEIWLAPDGHEVKGAELKRWKARSKVWPPPPARPDQKEWRLKFRGYEHDDILTRTINTDTNGEAELSFTPEREGYYRVSWTSKDRISNLKFEISNPIRAETTVWVADNRTTDLGYRTGGVQIIADKETFHVGQKAPVMLVAPANDRYVLFTVEGDNIYDYRLVHLEGNVKLIELPIEEKHVPNIFLSAAAVSDRQIYTDTKQVVVPPVKNFLTVNVKPDRAQYLPRQEGTLRITTTDDRGRPVSAEVALGLVDESVYYIQNDYAEDPRQFFFGTKRSERVQTRGTMNERRYVKLVEWKDHQLIDNQEKARLERIDEFRNLEVAWSGRKDRNGFGGGGASTFATGAAWDEISRLPAQAPAGAFPSMSRSKAMGGIPAAGVPAMPAKVPVLSDMTVAGQMFAGVSGQEKLPGFGPSSAGKEPAVIVRADFRSTVFWQPDVMTDQDGKATLHVKYPDSLTSWKATAHAVTTGNQFGIGDATTRTRQPLIVRLEAPRFFVVGDTVTISAVVNNNTDDPMEVRVGLDTTNMALASAASGPGSILEPVPLPRGTSSSHIGKPVTLQVPANGEARADWTVAVKQPGTVQLKVTARGSEYADAMEKTYTSYEHGIEKLIAKSGKVRFVAPQGEEAVNDVTVKLDLPKDRKPGTTSLTVQLTPSLAVTMLDALPYLINYPYGCTEQTMSRFLPAAITAKTLRDLGLKSEDVMNRVFGGIETNYAAATHPKGKRNLNELGRITTASLDRLYDFQHHDGGWGWWKEGDSDHWMTAYVVWGLVLAKDAGLEVKADALRRGVDYLEKTLVDEEDHYDMQSFMLHALAAYRSSRNETKPTPFEEKAFDNLWRNREKLNAYTRALLALSAHHFGKTSEAKILVQNLENGVQRDDHPDTSILINSQLTTHNSQLSTAHWGEDGVYWHWSDGGVEATAFALRAMLAIDPHNKLVEPVTNWLIKNRRGAQWDSTRSTAIVVLALNDYLRVSGELKPDLEYELIVNGKSIAKKRITSADVFEAPSRYPIDPAWIRDHNDIRITTRSKGQASLYFAVAGRFFSTEDPITAAGNEIFVRRDYYKLVSRPTLLKGYVSDRKPLRDGDSVKSGDRVEVVLTIEAKNNYEYLMFEDLKPAGLEAVQVRSGESLFAKQLKRAAFHTGEQGVSSSKNPFGGSISSPASIDYTGQTRWVYQELRDRKVALFIDKLPQGYWQIRYELRAEVPGHFHALPVVGQAMYVPEIRCNSREIRIGVKGK